MSAQPPVQIAKQKILVVDDNPASLYATVRILRAGGFDVIESDTGLGALKATENQDVGLIILDINLPDIDGLEVCRRLRARSQTAYLPIIHLTATFVTHNDMTQGLSAGGDSYLTHPVDPPVLIATVRALLFARQADILKRTTDARFRGDIGRAEAARRNHLGAAFHEARVAIGKATGLHLRRATIPARHPDCMAMVAIGGMMVGMMAGVIGPGVSPCAVVRPCRSRSDEYDDRHRTQCQRDETKRPAKRKQLMHT